MLNELFDRLWGDYLQTTPQAERVHRLLAGRGDKAVNDHIALRTFAHPRCDIETLDRAFVAGGYEPVESYEFPAKKLYASHYEHPGGALPKIFLSALLLDECSAGLRDTVHRLVAEVEPGAEAHPLFAASGRHWDLDHATYETLREESEYAAWVAAFGFRANHFTVDVDSLASFDGLPALLAFLGEQGVPLSDAGGLIKGSPEARLEQASTRAEPVEVSFTDGARPVPSGYVEFAKRHRDARGARFEGFLAASADRIFESTDRR